MQSKETSQKYLPWYLPVAATWPSVLYRPTNNDQLFNALSGLLGCLSRSIPLHYWNNWHPKGHLTQNQGSALEHRKFWAFAFCLLHYVTHAPLHPETTRSVPSEMDCARNKNSHGPVFFFFFFFWRRWIQWLQEYISTKRKKFSRQDKCGLYKKKNLRKDKVIMDIDYR